MGELVRHRQTKEAATDMFAPKVTAPHLDSTPLGLLTLQGDGMGTMVAFWLGAEDGICSHFLSAPLDEFENWVGQIRAEYPDEIEPDLPDLIRDVRNRGELAIQATDHVRAAKVDRMLDWFYGEFCSYGPGRDYLVAAVDAWTHRFRWYCEAEDLLRQAKMSSEMLQSWRFLIEGRPVLRDPSALPYTSEDGTFRLGYWPFAEVSRLLPELIRVIGADAAIDPTAAGFFEENVLCGPTDIMPKQLQMCRNVLKLTIYACSKAVEKKVGLIIQVA